MKLLLDTHTLIWFSSNSEKIPQRILHELINPDNSLYISAVSLWEIVIKVGLGKLDISFDNLLAKLANIEINILQIESTFLAKVMDLPYIHKDPFDRLIIATALVTDMTILTTDENIRKYDVSWMW